MKNLSLLLILLANTPITAQADTVDYNMSISFEQVARFYRAGFAKALGKFVRTADCDLVGTSADTRPATAQYKCGEIPLGEIQNDSTKKIYEINIPAQIDNSGDLTYRINPGIINVFMSRAQKAGEINLPNLDEKAVVPTPIVGQFGYSTFLQIDPRGDLVNNNFCVGLPGLSVNTSPVHLTGHMHKSIDWWPDADADLDIYINVGKGSFDSGRICGKLVTSLDANGLPVITLDSINAPNLYGIDHSGLTVKVDADANGFFSIISDIAGVFGYNLEGMIADAVRQKIIAIANKNIDIAVSEIKSGAWFDKHLQVTAQKYVDKFSDNLQAEIKALGRGRQMSDRIVQAGCLEMSTTLGLPLATQKKVFQICAHSVKVDTKFFQNNSDSRAAGCYSYQFNPRTSLFNLADDGSPVMKWWAQACQFDNRITVSYPSRIMPLGLCILDAFKAHKSVKAACNQEINDYYADIKSGLLDPMAANLVIDSAKMPDEKEYSGLRRVYNRQTGATLPDYVNFVPLWK